MKLNTSIKQIGAIVSCQILIIGFMVLSASALAQLYGSNDAGASAMIAERVATDECPVAEAPERAADLAFLDLSVGWLRR